MSQTEIPTSLTNKQRLLDAIAGKPVDRPPIWLMRQAGRYLPEYQKIKANYTFLEMCRTPDVAAEVSIQPLDCIGTDCVIIFNDILIPQEYMGQKVDFSDKGPELTPPIRDEAAVKTIHVARFDETPAVCETIKEVRRRVGEDTPIFGFAGAPFTMASYMVEGVTSKSLRYIKEMLYSRPDLLETLLERITETVIEYLRLQIKAGADAVQIFDTWAGELTREDYHRFALPWQKQVIEAIQAEGTSVILYVKGSTPFLDEMKASGATVVSADWRTPLRDVSDRLGAETVLQGNLDPTAMYAPPEIAAQRTKEILDTLGRKTRHIFNLGHGVLPGTPVESVKAVVDTVKSYRY